jgi:hypothetical protein
LRLFLKVGLLETVLDVREGRIQLGAYALGGSEDHNGNTSGDKSVFDSGRAGLIAKEAKRFGHGTLLGAEFPNSHDARGQLIST